MRYRLIGGGALAALAGLAAAFGCASNTAQCESFDQIESAIKFESPDAGIDPIPVSGAIVAVYVQPDDGAEPRFACSATRIRDGVFLTARHCLPSYVSPASSDESQPEVLVGTPRHPDRSGCVEPPALSSVARVVVHTELDLALLEIERAPDMTTSPTMSLSAAAPKPGESAFIAGYGLTEANTRESLRRLSAQVIEVNGDEITVQGTGGGACVGDSGGPLFTIRESGEAMLLGVLSKGSASCLGRDVYVDASGVREWAAMREVSERPPAPVDAGGLE